MSTQVADELDVVLRGKTGDIILTGGLTTTDYEESSETGTTVTINVEDQARVLYSSGLLDTNADGRLDVDLDLTLDDYEYRLALFDKAGDTFTLTFLDRAQSVLQHLHGPLKPRSSDHVAFAKRLVGQAGFDFVTPTGVPDVSESHSTLAAKAARATSDNRREPGVADSADVTVKGAKATALQKHNMNTVLAVCAAENAGEKATLACVEACIIEDEFRNSSTMTDHDSLGILQVRVGLHGRAVATSVTASVRAFLTSGFTGAGGAIALAKAHPDWSAGKVAQTVQGSDFPTRYDGVRAEAGKIVAAFTGASSSSSSSASSGGTGGSGGGNAEPVQVGTPENPNESFWTALQRFSAPRGYRCFAFRNTIYYGREQDFIRSRPRMTISEQAPGVDWINGQWAPNARVNTITVTCRASLWAAPPCSSVVVENEGPLSGRWLVSSFRRSRYSKVAEVEMRRGTELLKAEPAQANGSAALTSSTSQGSPGGPTTKAGKLADVEAQSRHISGQNRAYVYGGGHRQGELPNITASEGLDCSSSVSLALYRAGLLGPTSLVSGDLANWGEPGPGKTFTVYANASHVFIIFADGTRFDTSPHAGDSNQASGPHMRSGSRSTAGFVARHAPGDGR